MTEQTRIKRNRPLCPRYYLGLGWPIATDLEWFRKRLLFEEQFVPILGASKQPHGFPLVDRHPAKGFAGKVENLDFCLKLPQIRNQNPIPAYGPALDGHFAS